MSNIDKANHFYEEIKTLLHQARTHVYSTINTTMTQTVLANRKTDRRRGITRRIPCNLWESYFKEPLR